MIIVFEGIDRSGKSTQCRKLYEALTSMLGEENVVSLKYPDRKSPNTGPLIDDYLAGEVEMPPMAASLLLASNLWEMSEQIKNAHKDGKIVLIDRYTWSNVAYSAARGMSYGIFEKINEGLPESDLTIWMKADPKVVALRGGFGLERFEKLDFQIKVADYMQMLAKDHTKDPLLVINANQEEKVITDQIMKQVMELIKKP